MTPDTKRGRASQKVRLEDIARRCGISISTASRALAGEKGVRPDVRDRVLDAARSMHYAVSPSMAGRKVVLAASSAAMIDYARNQFTAQVLEGLHQRATALGIEIVTQPLGTGAGGIAALQRVLDDAEVAGFLFLTLDDDEVLALTRGFGKPVVLVNGDDPLMRLSSVTPCNRSAARMATDFLQGLGHRRILLLTNGGRRTIERRREGWEDAMRQMGVTGLDDLIVDVADWLPDLADAALRARIDARGLDFTAILAAGESLAAGALRGLQALGVAVPAQVSVIGMDDLPQAALYHPPLTSIHIPMRDIGGVALDLLLDGLGLPAGPARRVELACHIVERRSTAPCPPGAAGVHGTQ